MPPDWRVSARFDAIDTGAGARTLVRTTRFEVEDALVAALGPARAVSP